MSLTKELVEEFVGNAHGNFARVKELLEQHPELLNASAPWDETAIQAATQMGNVAIIDYLIERGARWISSPLPCWASESGCKPSWRPIPAW